MYNAISMKSLSYKDIYQLHPNQCELCTQFVINLLKFDLSLTKGDKSNITLM